MRKIIFSAMALGALIFAGQQANAQIMEEENVTITMDLQPVLQLDMTTSDQIDFVFDEISKYHGGIVKYGATQLRVSSSVAWDLYAVGFSQGNTGSVLDWDNMIEYGVGATTPGAVNTLPLDGLELRQYPANPASGGNPDYSQPFPPYDGDALNQGQGGQTNTIHVDAGGNPYNRPVAGDKYIAGHEGDIVAGEGVPGGSYLITTDPAGTSAYFYTVDYRIIPGLPATFPMADPATNQIDAGTGEYAAPGVYTMNVKYVLLEDI